MVGSPLSLEHSRVCDQGTKGHMQSGTPAGGLIFPTDTKPWVPQLLGKPAAPKVQSNPASPHSRAVRHTLSRWCHKTKGRPLRGCCVKSPTHPNTCMHIGTGTRACPQMPTSACTPRLTCSVLTHLSLSPDVPRPCMPSPSCAACHCHVSAGLPAWQVLLVAMAILCLPGDGVCSPMLQ